MGGHCKRIHLIDSGGDVLSTVLTNGIMTKRDELDVSSLRLWNSEDSITPRKERDVWSLLLVMALRERLSCPVQLVVMAPGVDGQSVWLGPRPKTTSSADSDAKTA